MRLKLTCLSTPPQTIYLIYTRQTVISRYERIAAQLRGVVEARPCARESAVGSASLIRLYLPLDLDRAKVVSLGVGG